MFLIKNTFVVKMEFEEICLDNFKLGAGSLNNISAATACNAKTRVLLERTLWPCDAGITSG